MWGGGGAACLQMDGSTGAPAPVMLHVAAHAPFLACTGGQVESGVALGVHGREELCGPSLPLEQVLKGRLVAARRRMQKSHKHTESLGLGQEEACSCN